MVTLVYLAIQTRSISKQNQAEARYAFVEAMAAINMVVAQSTPTASIWRRGLESVENLTEDERMQFFMLLGQYANLWSVMHQLREDSLLPDTQWLIVKNDVASILGSDGGKYFWSNGGETAFDASFSKFVNALLKDHRQPYDMAKMTANASDTDT